MCVKEVVAHHQVFIVSGNFICLYNFIVMASFTYMPGWHATSATFVDLPPLWEGIRTLDYTDLTKVRCKLNLRHNNWKMMQVV